MAGLEEDILLGSFYDIPLEIIQHHVLTKLTVAELSVIARVNSKFKKIVDSDILWKTLFLRDLTDNSLVPEEAKNDPNWSWKSKYEEFSAFTWNENDVATHTSHKLSENGKFLTTSGSWSIVRIGSKALPTKGLFRLEFEIEHGSGSNFMFGALGADSHYLQNLSGYPGHGNMGFSYSSDKTNCCLYIDNKAPGTLLQMWIDNSKKTITWGWQGSVSYRKENNNSQHMLSTASLKQPLWPCISTTGAFKIRLIRPNQDLYQSPENLF